MTAEELNMIRRVDHIGVSVPDVEMMAEFFGGMGFEVVRRTDHHGGCVEMRLPGENQVLFEFTLLRGEEVPGVNHVALEVDDAAAMAADLKAKGVKFSDEAHKVAGSGRVVANFRDPLGFRLQLTEM
jgi:glyoxylase I family protein